jgi:hypothetical protein
MKRLVWPIKEQDRKTLQNDLDSGCIWSPIPVFYRAPESTLRLICSNY